MLTPTKSGSSRIDQQQLDIASLNLDDEEEAVVYEEPPKMTLAREKVIEEAKKAMEGTGVRQGVSLVVIGYFSTFGSLVRSLSALCRSRRCREVDSHGQITVRTRARRREEPGRERTC
jgi:hypothetical protein